MKSVLATLSIASAAFIDNLNQLFNEKSYNLLNPESKPLINSEKLQAQFNSESLENWAEKLWSAANTSTEIVGHPTRAIGTSGHNATLEIIFDALDELSDFYTFEAQPFVAIDGRVHSWNVTQQSGEPIEGKPLYMCPPADVTDAPLHFLMSEGCLPSEYADAEGKIVVLARGGCPFGAKSEFAGLAGVKAVLIFDPSSDSSEVLLKGDLGTPLEHQVAVIGVSQDTIKMLSEGDLMSINVDSEIVQVDTVNIIAETKDGDHDNVVFAGSHSDSVLAGPGLNDNGSGLIAMLELAKHLTGYKLKNAVRLAWWSAEELGLKGSLYYTENLTKKEASKIRLFLDFDMLASPNYIYEIYDSDDSENPQGSGAIRDMFEDWYKSHDLNFTTQPFDGRSDYVGFIEIGIPAGGIDTGAEEIKSKKEAEQFGGTEDEAYDVCYHAACDELDNVNYEAWLTSTKLLAHSVATYAKSLEGFPTRDNGFYKERAPKPRRWFYNNLV